MPARHRRLSSTGNCEVVPLHGEPPCSEPRGFKERPRLCLTHHQEYVRLTAEYHATTEEAKGLYRRVRALGLNDATLVRSLPAADVETALVTTKQCIDIINKEIRERREHHTRFFVELHDGHEERIKKQHVKLAEVEDIELRLRRRKTALAKVQRRRAQTARCRGESTLRRPRSIGTTESPAATADTCNCISDSMPGTSHTPPEATPRPVCVAYLTGDTHHAPSRARCTSERAYRTLRCQEHQDEYTQTLSTLRAAEREYSDMGASIYHIKFPRRPVSAETLSQDIPLVGRYLALADNIAVLSEKLSRLDGYSKPTNSYCKACMEIYGLSRDVVENLRIELESTLSELLRSKPEQVTKQQVTPTSTQYSRRETQDSYRATMPATRTAPQCYSEDEGLGWGTVIAAAAVGIAVFFRFVR